MPKINFFIVLTLAFNCCFTQEVHEIELEQMAQTDEIQLRDPLESSTIAQDIAYNINNVSAEQLSSLFLLTPQQISEFIIHRKKYGKFISLLELQAIPLWELTTIKKILPHLYLANQNDKINVKHSLTEGKHFLIYRTGGRSNGFNSKETWITKNKQMVNYKFKFKDQFQAGLMIEKDAGEKNVFDHTGIYLLLRNRGIIKDFLIGDYNINMGQGLVHWQGYAFGRSSNLLSGYRQGYFIQPHTGTDENRFQRGIAINLKKGKTEIGVFMSRLQIDANVMNDSINNRRWVSSFLLSGLHRNDAEKADKDVLSKLTVGGKFKYQLSSASIALNYIQTFFSIPIQKRQQPYNQFAIAGRHWKNISIDFTIPTKAGFIFSEFALDQQFDPAFNLGWLKSLDPKLDLSFIYRNMSARYRAFESNCISSNSEAGNEAGLLLSFNFQPHAKHHLEGFADFYQNQWPTFTSDRSENGRLISIQYNWKPNKKTEISTRYQIENKTSNQGYEQNRTSLIGQSIVHRWRTHLSFSPLESLTIRCRNEVIKVQQEFNSTSIGHLSYLEMIFKPMTEPLSLSFRYTFFSTDNYASRVYAYERDLLSFYAIPAHFDQGKRSYLLVQYNYKKAVKLQMKIISDHRKDKNNITAAYQSPLKNKEWRMQVIWEFGN